MNEARKKYLVDGEIVTGLGNAMERAAAIYDAEGVIVAIEEVTDDVQ